MLYMFLTPQCIGIYLINVMRIYEDKIYKYLWFQMILNYQVEVERYPFPNGVVGGSIPAVKSSLYLTDNKPHLASRVFLSRVEPFDSNSCQLARCWLFIYSKINSQRQYVWHLPLWSSNKTIIVYFCNRREVKEI